MPPRTPSGLPSMRERLGRYLWFAADSAGALTELEAAIAILPADPPSAERARVLSGYGQLLMLLDRFDESRELCEQAIDIAMRVGARQAEGHARNTLGLDLVAQGHVTPAWSSSIERSRSPTPRPTSTTSAAAT